MTTRLEHIIAERKAMPELPNVFLPHDQNSTRAFLDDSGSLNLFSITLTPENTKKLAYFLQHNIIHEIDKKTFDKERGK